MYISSLHSKTISLLVMDTPHHPIILTSIGFMFIAHAFHGPKGKLLDGLITVHSIAVPTMPSSAGVHQEMDPQSPVQIPEEYHTFQDVFIKA